MDTTLRRPAIVPVAYPKQRLFTETAHNGGISANSPPPCFPMEARVLRHAGENHAELALELLGFSWTRIQLDPANLRRLASDLLDAAADIEDHPAAKVAPS